MRKVNIVRLKGGLGNQLFIYAFFLSLSKITNNKCYLDFSHYKYFRNSGKIELENAFDIEIMRHEAPKDLIRKLSNRDYELFLKIIIKIFGSKKTHYIDLEMGFDPNVYLLSNHYLDGYWQSYRYFDFFRDEIIEHLLFKSFKGNSYLTSLIEKIKSSNDSVSLHVRGTDYINSDYYINLIYTNYYRNSLEKLGLLTKTVFVFTDDKDFVLSNRFFDNFILVETESNENYLDMYLMSICHHNIIANSSYSWWSAYLNVNPGKMVIAPSEWFNNRDINLDDLYPDNWTIANIR